MEGALEACGEYSEQAMGHETFVLDACAGGRWRQHLRTRHHWAQSQLFEGCDSEVAVLLDTEVPSSLISHVPSSLIVRERSSLH